MATVSVFTRLFFILKYGLASFIEFTKCQVLYGFRYKMLWIDLGLFWQYPFTSPYRINLRYLEKNNLSKSYLFGETPLTTLEKICQRINIEPKAVIFDVGCGWGKSTFFLHAYNKAHRTIGIDILPEYIQKAERIRKWMKLDYIVFLEADFRQIDYSDADVIYLYGSCLPDDTIQSLVTNWENSLMEGTIIITTTYSLPSYATQGRILLQDTIELDFLWGECTVHYHTVIDASAEANDH